MAKNMMISPIFKTFQSNTQTAPSATPQMAPIPRLDNLWSTLQQPSPKRQRS